MSICLFTVRSTEIRLNLLTVPVIALFLLTGTAQSFLVTLLALCLHEYCHVCAARARGIDTLCIELMPCGFSARFSEVRGLSDTFFICLAGVLFSIVSGVCVLGLCSFLGFNSLVLRSFCYISIVYGAINILPVMPLDGGRMLKSVLSLRMYERDADRLMLIISSAVSCAFCGVSIWGLVRGYLNYSALILSALMFAGTLSQLKRRQNTAKNALYLTSCAGSGRHMPVSMHAFGENADISDVKAELDGGKYNVIRVIDKSLATVRILDESDILRGMQNGCKTLNDLK